MTEFPVEVFWSDDDGSYVADIPELVSCAAFGASPEEALAEVQVAKDAWLETARSHGLPIPRPSTV